jgi:hypothetical protein
MKNKICALTLQCNLTILGPLLFLVYINDLPKAVEHKALPILFPDDTNIILTSPNNTQMQ